MSVNGYYNRTKCLYTESSVVAWGYDVCIYVYAFKVALHPPAFAITR